MIRIDVKRTSFFNELSDEKQKEYFYQKAQSYLPNIDNIYYSVSFKLDHNDNFKLKQLFYRLERKKEKVIETRESQQFFEDLYLDYKSFNIYKYCLTAPDLFDIFILDYLPNDETPRVLVQIRSEGLWLHGYNEMIKNSFNYVKSLFNYFSDLKVDRVMENRIDYCYHTNSVQNMDKTLGDVILKNSMKTTMYTWHGTGRIVRENGLNRLKKDYFALGERKSNYVFVRFYNKVIEVIEKGYKAYFFKIWLDNGLINQYDMFCFEYAYINKNFEHIHKAKLEFYIEYGKDEKRKAYYKSVLDNPDNTITDIQKIASEYMPECTTIMNVEFETKRKFYYLSDDFIDNLLCVMFPADVLDPKLLRLMTLMHNRHVFLEYLTSKVVCFKKKDDTYVDWWNRLRNVKIKEEGAYSEKLLRKYSNDLDIKVMKKRFVNAAGSLSVYMQKSTDNTFVEDVTDIFSLINDNDKEDVNGKNNEVYQKFMVLDDNGEIIQSINSKVLDGYNDKKARKEKLLRNRLKDKKGDNDV